MKKRILALLMALSLTFVFVGCGDDASKKKDKEEEKIEEKAKEKEKEEKKEAKKADKKDDEEEIIEVLEGLYDSTQKMDVEGMKKYLDPDSKKYEKIETSFSDTFNFEALEQMGIPSEKIEGYIKIVYDVIEFSVGKITIDGDSATAKVEMKIPDLMSVSNDEMTVAFLQSKGYTEEQFITMFASDQAGVFAELYDWMFTEYIQNLDLTTQKKGTNLVKKDGKWYVTDSDEDSEEAETKSEEE